MCWKMGSIPQNVDLDRLGWFIRILSSYPHLYHLKLINKSWTHGEKERRNRQSNTSLLCRIKEWKRKQGRSKCSCISPIDVSFFDTWMDICFPFYVFVLWMHNCLLDYLYRILWSLEGLRVIFVNAGLVRRTEGIFVEWKTNQGSNVIQRRRTGQFYFQ